MKLHHILALAILVLVTVLGFAIYRDVSRQTHEDSQDHAQDAAHDHADGELYPESAKELEIMTGALQPSTPPAAPERTIVRFTTSMGAFDVTLFDDLAPKTVENFLTLTNKGFYNGLVFHRIIKDFMNQSGCPLGTGTGGPGYNITDEFNPRLKHDQPGILSMANTGRPNTGGSQFFITAIPTPWLDGKHAVFGLVTKGLDVALAINAVKTGPGDRPLTPVTIEKIEIVDAASSAPAQEAPAGS